MLDYMLRFPDEDAARAALPFPEEDTLPASWPWGAHSIAPISLFRLTGPADPESGEPTAEPVEGYWLAVYTRDGDEALWSQPYTMVEADRAGEGPTRLKPEIAGLVAGVHVSPHPAGAAYRPVEG